MRANFRHFGTGFEVRWYKYIGRSMETVGELTPLGWETVLQECKDSLILESQPG